MGLFSWLFPSPEDRIAKAGRLLAQGRPDEARLEVMDLDHPGATAILAEAENALAVKNLEAALQAARVGDDQRAAEHLELATAFHKGGHEAAFQETRRELREIRSGREDAEARAKAEQNARLLQVDPLGVAGGSFADGAPADPGVFEPDEEEVAQRLALIVESYPEALRERVSHLGAEFARAVLDLEEGRPESALPALVALPDSEPLVLWERARVAHALGDPASAAKAVRGFAQHAGGHQRVGTVHSGEYLAVLLAESGDLPAALRTLREVRSREPKVGGFLFAQLLFATRALPEAEQVLTQLVRENPKQPALYTMLARVRIAGDHRMQAMRALEACLETACCTPGKCGSQPPDLEVHRLLATLYLEDGIEKDRALELAEIAASLVERPVWDDAYLQAMVARSRGLPEATRIADHLRRITPSDHPAAERLARFLPAPGLAG